MKIPSSETYQVLRPMVNPEWEYKCRVCGTTSVFYLKDTKINICSIGCYEVYSINPLAYDFPYLR